MVPDQALRQADVVDAPILAVPRIEPSSVELQGVSKEFGDVTALRDVTLDARPGEFLVLLGPSGCGKSTVLRLIAGLEAPSAGTIRIGGEAMNRVVTKNRDVAMVFQSYALYPHMSVRKNIEFPLRSRGCPATTSRTSSPGWPRASGSRRSSAAGRRSSPEASASASPWPGHSSAAPRCS